MIRFIFDNLRESVSTNEDLEKVPVALVLPVAPDFLARAFGVAEPPRRKDVRRLNAIHATPVHAACFLCVDPNLPLRVVDAELR